ncbi:hypothetical protein O181_009453 [Austropuccinia psidii MF-1]|uniref:Uncharacterized protein n=1 Tax=Austropuccinia psidii MF-1 TaxID=1389203 RepID=A0A9Q3BRE1_9BASI|nr:hypothetical protein [Austropuccinia psidii MF-1]
MEGAAPSRKEGRGPRSSILLSGLVGVFPGISRTKLKGPGDDNSEEGSDSTEAAPTPVGEYQANFSEDRNKVLYATSSLIGRASKWIYPYVSNLRNQDPAYLLNNWALFKSQLFTLFGDPNDVRKAEAELDGLRMKEGEVSILGFDLLSHFNPSIDWRWGLITCNSDDKDYYYPSQSSSNDIPSAKSCAALFGYSRTPSFLSSVHIPSLNSHQSLLSSRAEVFKEIQDVGEDNSVSSLHLFPGNVDLPPASYHDSLEVLWGEEEEPEEI